MVACSHGREGCLRLLIAAGADLERQAYVSHFMRLVCVCIFAALLRLLRFLVV